MAEILSEALDKLQAEAAAIRIDFKYFVERQAPVSGRCSVLDVDCFFAGKMSRGKALEFTLGVKVPYTSLCPCSKEISRYGAHNQRGILAAELGSAQAMNVFLLKIWWSFWKNRLPVRFILC